LVAGWQGKWDAMKVPPRVFAFIIMFGLIAYMLWSHPPNPWTWMQTLGVCLMVAGYPLWLLAHAQLGASFTARPKARSLVTQGLYSKIRNPIYLFGAMAIAGTFLFLGRPYLLLIFVVLIPVQLVRMRKEARVLEDKFGDEYRNYRRGTWF
jgi:protein-S-isoprenylcysteine O-methyltransferase Ste14